MNRLLVLALLLAVWVGAHVPAIRYGTADLPLHMSYIGDEQAPVNGALHILADRDLLALRNLKTVYYGPVFSLIAVPGAALDFLEKYLSGAVTSAAGYRDSILWDWGGIVWKERLVALIFGAFGVWALFSLLSTVTVNPSRARWLPWVGATLLATNFYYFEYSSFFRHWAFVVPMLIGQIHCLVRLEETGRRRYWAWSLALFAAGFGVSYVSALFQVMWLPFLASWAVERNRSRLRAFGLYCLGVAAAVALVVVWHPHAFNRLLGLSGGDVANVDVSAYTAEVQDQGFSLGYYSSLIFENNLGVILAVAVLLVFLWKPARLRSQKWFWTTVLPGITFFAVFAVLSHHESRYMLPVIALLVVLLGGLAGQYLALPHRPRLLSVALITLVTWGVAFNVAHVGRWLVIQGAGPKERAFIAELVEFQKQNPDAKILVFQPYLLGHAHAKEAYADYASRSGKADLNLYRAIAGAPLPAGVTPLNVYYSRWPEIEPAMPSLNPYGRVAIKYDPSLDADREPDYFDVDLTRLWFYDDLSEKYRFVR